MTNESLRARIDRVREQDKNSKHFHPTHRNELIERASIIQALESKLGVITEALQEITEAKSWKYCVQIAKQALSQLDLEDEMR